MRRQRLGPRTERLDSLHCRNPEYTKDRDQVVPWGPRPSLAIVRRRWSSGTWSKASGRPLSGWNKFGLESYIDSDSLVSEPNPRESNIDCADNVDCAFR